MSRNLAHALRAVAILAVVALAAACGKPTLQGAVSSYKSAKDKLDALVAKVSPQMKMDIRKKIMEFETEFKAAEAKGGEEAMRAISALTTRVNKYRNAVDPQAGKKAAANAGSKLNKTGAPAAGQPQPATGGKLGTARPATAAPAPAAGATGGSGFGNKPATGPTTGPRPATGPTTGPRPATAPATGGSGFGGK